MCSRGTLRFCNCNMAFHRDPQAKCRKSHLRLVRRSGMSAGSQDRRSTILICTTGCSMLASSMCGKDEFRMVVLTQVA